MFSKIGHPLQLLALIALLTAACTGTAPSETTVDPAQPPATVEAAETAPAAPPTTEAPTTTAAAAPPPTTEATAPTAPPTTATVTTAPPADVPMPQGLALIEAAISDLTAAVAFAVQTFDDGGLDALKDIYSCPDHPSAPFFFVVDGNDEIVVHCHEELIGASIAGELGQDMYGYPWHERIEQATPDGVFTLMMSRRGSHNAIAAPGGGEAGLSVFDDYRADLLMYRVMPVVLHDGYRFAFASPQVPTALASTAVLEYSAFLLAGGTDVDEAGDIVTGGLSMVASLVDAGRWHGDRSDSGRFLGLVADADGVVVNSNFDPSIVGQAAAELLGPDALSAATPDGARYRDESRGVDVLLLLTPQGFVVGGGVAGR